MNVQEQPAILLAPGKRGTDVLTYGIDALPAPGTRVHVAAGWQYDERTVDRLRALHVRMIREYGRGLVDPTGLLGVETSTTQTADTRAARVITDAPPVGVITRRTQPAPRKQQPTRAHVG